MTSNKDNYVTLYVPKGYVSDDPNVFISINGKNYLLPKGKTSLVPQCVKAEYERSQQAQEALDARSANFLEKANKPL